MTSPRHWVLPLLGVAAIPATSLLLADQLPTPVARHFGTSGVADGASSLVVLTLLTTVVTAAIAVGSLVSVQVTPSDSGARSLVAASHFVGAGLALLHWRVLWVQRGLEDWRAAQLPLGEVVLLLGVGGGLAAVIGWWLAGSIEIDAADRTEGAVGMDVAPGESLVWSGRSGTSLPLAIGAVLMLAAVAAWLATGNLWLTGILLVAAGVTPTALSVRVTVGPGGLLVRGGLVAGLPRTHVPLEEIDDVRIEQVQLLSYGGIGYRVAPGVRAIVPRTGEGLRVVRDDDHDVVVTVPGAREAARVLASHLHGAETA